MIDDLAFHFWFRFMKYDVEVWIDLDVNHWDLHSHYFQMKSFNAGLITLFPFTISVMYDQ